MTTVPLLVALALAGLSAWWALPPSLTAGQADADRFSVSRAMADVEVLAARPRPLGSEEHERARRYVVGRLEQLGLEVETQEATATRRRGRRSFIAVHVTNVVGRLRGRGAAGAILLVAHYDSRPQTFGAADDAAGVATILEVVRAIQATAPLQRDLIVLLSDGEEFDLSGARAFVEGHRWMADIEVVLNIEARGNRGASMMFETAAGNLELMREFATAVPLPFANSLSYEVYRRMPNDSDFSLFKAAGVSGFNFAFIGNHSAYHTELDAAAHLDRKSLAHQGTNLLALTRHFGNLERLPRSTENAVYFTLPGWYLIVYSYPTARRLAVGLALLVTVAFVANRQSHLTAGGLGRGAVLALISTAAGFAVGSLAWAALASLAPSVLAAPHGRPYRTLWFGAAIACAVLGLVVWLSRRFSRPARPLELSAGVLLVWATGAVIVSYSLPGASFLLTWPAVAGWIAWWLAARRASPSSGPPIEIAVGALPAVVLLVPLALLFLQALTLSGAGVPAALFGLLLTLFAPQLAQLSRFVGEIRLVAILWAASIAIALTAVGLSIPSAERPGTDSLFFVSASDGDYWYSLDREPDAWTGSVLGRDMSRLPSPSGLFLDRERVVLRAPASVAAADLTLPRVESEAVTVDGVRRVSLEVSGGNGGQFLRLATSGARVLGLSIGDTRFESDASSDSVRLTLLGPPDSRWKLGFEVQPHQPLEVEILEQIYGLSGVASSPSPRPPTLIPVSSWRTDSTYVQRRVTL